MRYRLALGVLALLLWLSCYGQDAPTAQSASPGFFSRSAYALAFAYVDRSDSGRHVLALSNFAGATSGGFVGNAERLRACARAFVQFSLNHPHHYRLMFMTAFPLVPNDEPLARKGNPNEDAYAFLHSILTLAIDAGSFRPEYKDSDLVAQTLWVAVHGVASLQITRGCQAWLSWAPFDRRSETTLDGILCGLANLETRSREAKPNEQE